MAVRYVLGVVLGAALAGCGGGAVPPVSGPPTDSQTAVVTPAAVTPQPIVTAPPGEPSKPPVGSLPPLLTLPPVGSVPLGVHEDHIPDGMPRTVTFANLDLTVTDAWVSDQTVDSYVAGTDAVPGPEKFVYFSVTVVNRSTAASFQAVRFPVDFALELATTDVLTPVDRFESLIQLDLQPNASIESFLAFPLPRLRYPTEFFEGVVLHVGAPPDRTATLPLTGPVPEPEYPQEIAVSGEVTAPGPPRGEPVTVTLLSGSLSEDLLPGYDWSYEAGIRADAGTLFLNLHVRASQPGPTYPDAGNDLYRLLVDGVPRVPFEPQYELFLDPGIPLEYDVSFIVPDDAGSVVLEVGAVNETTESIEIDLPGGGS
jgi:hypothetical protein